MKRLLLALIGALLCGATQAQTTTFQPYRFVAADGTAVEAEMGTLSVPERHQNAAGKRIALKFVRFKSTAAAPGAPIIYLAGGPGGSGIAAARGERFPLFMKLRAVADVIALDQRGAGDSGEAPECTPASGYPFDKPLAMGDFVAFAQKAAAECALFWRSTGVDLNAYNNRESAADLALLRTALGVPKLALWGISYGSQLALATAKYHPDAVERLVLASSEGLGQTIKSPQRIDLMPGRLAQLVAADASALKRYPDFLGSMARVHRRLDAKPLVAEFKHPASGKMMTVGIGKLDIQLLVAYMIKNPAEAAMLPALYAAMEGEQYQFVAPHVARMRGHLLRWQAMPLAMDAASGIDAVRWRSVQAQSASALLGRASDLPLPDINAALGVRDLGDDYRREPVSDIPALFIAGSLDGRTVIESQMELVPGFRQAQTLRVQNAGHDLLVVSPAVGDAIVRFLRGQPQQEPVLGIAAPSFM